MQKIILASSNPGKIKEVQVIFEDFDVISLKEAEKLLSKEIKITEDQETFSGNALEKACGLYEQVGSDFICIADDSGLVIDCLDGFPGVHTARWLDADDHTKNLALLEKVEAEMPADRSCHYTTAIAIKSSTIEKVFKSTLDGIVAKSCRGDNGFGFDEIFELPSGKTLAEITFTEKNQLSPRRQALDQLRVFIQNMVNKDT